MEKLTKYKNLINTYEKFSKKKIRLENYKEDLLKNIFKPWEKDGVEYGVLLCKLKKMKF